MRDFLNEPVTLGNLIAIVSGWIIGKAAFVLWEIRND